MIEGHGDDLYRYGGKVRMNFSSNILQGVCHSPLLRHLALHHECVTSYPEPAPLSLERMLESRLCLPEGGVMVTNGATEAIYMIAARARVSVSTVVGPTFSEYADACRMHGHRVNPATSPADISGDESTVWICNPNNPTGRLWDKADILSLARENPRTLWVVDQAYADYTLGETVTPAEAIEAGNIILLSSLTKRFSIPGLRVGYAVANPSILSPLRSQRMPWSVSGPAIEGARFLLDNADDYPVDARALHSEALRIARGFADAGIEVEPTDCNFFLSLLPGGRTAAALKEWLVECHGILIRDASNFEGLLPGHFRVAAQTPAENNLLIKAVKEWITL